MNSLRNIIRKKAAVLVSIAVLLTGIHRADATATATFTVTASVVASCTTSATNLAFGNYTLAAVSSTSTITVTCTNGSTVKIGLNAGTGPSASVTNRKMTSGANTLLYGLYQDSAHTTNWGNTPGTDTVNTTATGVAQNFIVYALLYGNQTSPIAVYTDTVTITVSFA